jgi:hypothetical protein
MAIHSTVLIDKTGRVHWAKHGGGPFTDYDFLAAQLERMNAIAVADRSPQRDPVSREQEIREFKSQLGFSIPQ